MGVTVRLTLFASSQSKANEAAKAAFARFRTLDDMMSDYQQGSELNRFCAAPINTWTSLSPELYETFRNAQQISVLSDGGFDITAGPVVRLWRQARRESKLPAAAAIQDALNRTGFRKLELENGRARLLAPGMQLDLGGIAKGYACDEAIAALLKEGITSAMVEAGGDISVSDPPPGTDGWRIAILGWPGVEIKLKNESMSTSGDAEQFVELGGVRYSHVVDPRTGMGLVKSRQATIVGKMGWLTDALSTTACILPRSDAEALAKRLGVRAWLKESP